jgi:uncharacterized protein with gpF-like domain
MAGVKIRYAGVSEILKERMRGPIDALARQIADRVDVGSTGAEVIVRSYTTDRAAAAVSIAHPAGLAIQAKHGSLTKAAASLGLEVTAK